MKVHHKGKFKFFTYEQLDEFRDIIHFTTSRQGGISTGNYRSLNMSLNVGDAEEKVHLNQKVLASAFGLEKDDLVFPGQVHGNDITLLGDKNYSKKALSESDALVTDKRGICLCTLSADCANILLYDHKKKAIGNAHAGWRGTVSNITGNMVKSMKRNFGTNAEDILAVIGPCIGMESYEVGKEVAAAFKQLFGKDENIVRKLNERFHVDIGKANQKLLTREGVAGNNIHLANTCTYTHKDMFFSARRAQRKTGRFCSGIMLVEQQHF